MLAPVFDQASDIVHEEYAVSLWETLSFHCKKDMKEDTVMVTRLTVPCYALLPISS